MTVALLDACVLYPPSLRDLLMRLAADEAYYPRWPSEIQSEWVRNVLANKPATSETQLERTRRLMEQVDPDCLVTGYEPHISTLLLPDPNDRHVLAAAIESDAAVIVTYNLSDFPDTALQAYAPTRHCPPVRDMSRRHLMIRVFSYNLSSSFVKSWSG